MPGLISGQRHIPPLPKEKDYRNSVDVLRIYVHASQYPPIPTFLF